MQRLRSLLLVLAWLLVCCQPFAIVNSVSAAELSPQTASVELEFSPSSASVAVGNTISIGIVVNNITNLYGYQFEVLYDPTKVAASGTFNNTFFDSTKGFSPPGWKAVCDAGVCKFAITLLRPAPAVTGSGTLVNIQFTGLAAGEVPLTIRNSSLVNVDVTPVLHQVSTGMIFVTPIVAQVSGVIALQGRASPLTSGTVTLTSSGAPPITVPFDATTGVFSVVVPASQQGITYTVNVSHGLYLDRVYTGLTLKAGEMAPLPPITLLAGDANDDGKVSIGDIACVGSDFGLAATSCGTTGSSDINGDGQPIDISDLVLVGGNFDLASPLSWE